VISHKSDKGFKIDGKMTIALKLLIRYTLGTVVNQINIGYCCDSD